jgi:hypothetical protein
MSDSLLCTNISNFFYSNHSFKKNTDRGDGCTLSVNIMKYIGLCTLVNYMVFSLYFNKAIISF